MITSNILRLLVLGTIIYLPEAAAELSVDVCRFKGEQGRAYVELYLDLPRAALTHYQTPGGWYGALHLKVDIVQDTSLLASDSWIIEDIISDPSQITLAQRIIDGRVYAVETGLYGLIAEARDSLSNHKWRRQITLVVDLFEDADLTLSDIELSSYLLPAGQHPRFDRGDCAIIPNPRRLFGLTQPYFISYFEVYPPAADSLPAEYFIRRWITNGLGETVLTLPLSQLTAGPEAFADIDSVHLDALATGSWILNIEVKQAGSGKTAFRSQRFYIFQSEKPPIAASAQPTVEVDSAKIESEFKEVEFLLSKAKMTAARNMSVGEKAQFLEAFWRRYDDDTATSDVPARRFFRERVTEADKRWNNSRTAGHKTDRGRIYALYGEPDERETHPLDIHAKPYEIWNYHKLQGGAVFVFVDRSGFDDYVLVHSTLPGEVNDVDWYKNYAQRSGMDAGR
ncbi:MAG: GWxTD domain-containing protein [Calditrichaeota bacterium]|nr:GWxTD domain-containing protein [Calditrichota bacterium]